MSTSRYIDNFMNGKNIDAVAALTIFLVKRLVDVNNMLARNNN